MTTVSETINGLPQVSTGPRFRFRWHIVGCSVALIVGICLAFAISMPRCVAMGGPVRVTKGLVAGQEMLIVQPQPHNPWGQCEWFQVVRSVGSEAIQIQEMRILWNPFAIEATRLSGRVPIDDWICIPLGRPDAEPVVEYWDGQSWISVKVDSGLDLRD